MADGGEEAAARVSSPEHLEEYHHLIELGLDTRVASKLEEIYQTGKRFEFFSLPLSNVV